MSDVMSRPARIALHAACLRRTFSLRRTGRLATLRWHSCGIARAIFCDWLTPRTKQHLHNVASDFIGDMILIAYALLWCLLAIGAASIALLFGALGGALR